MAISGRNFQVVGRFGWGVGVVKSQFITLPEEIAARDRISIGEVRFGSSS